MTSSTEMKIINGCYRDLSMRRRDVWQSLDSNCGKRAVTVMVSGYTSVYRPKTQKVHNRGTLFGQILHRGSFYLVQ